MRDGGVVVHPQQNKKRDRDSLVVLHFRDLRNKKGIAWSRQHVFRMVRMGRFPAPVKLGEATNAWVEAEIDDWLEARVAERDGKAV
jgi:prophage regulatory protein